MRLLAARPYRSARLGGADLPQLSKGRIQWASSPSAKMPSRCDAATLRRAAMIWMDWSCSWVDVKVLMKGDTDLESLACHFPRVPQDRASNAFCAPQAAGNVKHDKSLIASLHLNHHTWPLLHLSRDEVHKGLVGSLLPSKWADKKWCVAQFGAKCKTRGKRRMWPKVWIMPETHCSPHFAQIFRAKRTWARVRKGESRLMPSIESIEYTTLKETMVLLMEGKHSSKYQELSWQPQQKSLENFAKNGHAGYAMTRWFLYFSLFSRAFA